VKDALRSYQALYGGPEHRDTIAGLRQVAARVMRLLDAFQPRLVGSVLDGTANAHSRIALHIFADPVETAILFLADRNVAFDQEQRPIRWFNGQHRLVQVLVLEFDGIDVELVVFEPVNLRQSTPGQPRRGGISAGAGNVLVAPMQCLVLALLGPPVHLARPADLGRGFALFDPL
jgi:hypothetical protein